MSLPVEEGRGMESEDRSSSSSFEDLAAAEVEEAKREAAVAEEKVALEEKSAQKDGAPKKDEWQDVLGSGVLLKKILNRGVDDSEDAVRPQRGDLCTISYELRLRRGEGDAATPGDLVEKRDHFKIYMGDNEVLQGMDLAISLMYAGERCLLQISPRFAYSQRGLHPGDLTGNVERPEEVYSGPDVTEGSWLYADLALHEWTEEPEHESLSFADRMKTGSRRRARGNWWYCRGDTTSAVQLYRRALDALDESTGGISDPTPSGEPAPVCRELQELLAERVRVHNNMAAAQLRAGAYDAALQAVNHVLSCEPDNAKALFRKCRILAAMGRWDEALPAARAAAAAAPDDPAVRRELGRCEEKGKRDRSAERKLARRMLGAEAKPESDPKKPSRTRMLVWGSLLLSIVVGVASVLVYRYRTQAQ